MEKEKGEPKGATSAVKGIIIWDKCPRDEIPNISPLKKKVPMPLLEDKKNGPAVKAPAKSKATSSLVMSKIVPTSTTLGDGTL